MTSFASALFFNGVCGEKLGGEGGRRWEAQGPRNSFEIGRGGAY